jgi:hypothetical protein
LSVSVPPKIARYSSNQENVSKHTITSMEKIITLLGWSKNCSLTGWQPW